MMTTDPETSRLLDAVQAVDDDTRARLHARLVAAAKRDGVLDVSYRMIDTPVGSLLLATTERGLLRVVYEREGHDVVLDRLATEVSPRILRVPRRLDEASRQLAEYFSRARTEFDLPLDMRLAKGFRRAVLTHLPKIAYGHTESYAQVATAAGSPRAVRAVGTACAMNPLPVIVPCHRVIRSDGSFGDYVGGPQAKQTLLTLEAKT
jgi:methylated-DNA-[protein]-cysteine S-methyltransferase